MDHSSGKLSSPLAISVSSLTGRSYHATHPLPADTCVLDIATPYAYTIYKQFRNEVCAECWRYEGGRRNFLTCRDYGETAGLLFCDGNCRDTWLRREGEMAVQCLKTVEAARRRVVKGKAKAIDKPIPETVTDEQINQAWEDVKVGQMNPKVLKQWKNIQLDDFETDLARYVLMGLIHFLRESDAPSVVMEDKLCSHDSDSSSSVVSEEATWQEFADLQPNELHQVKKFPELLENHTNIYKVLKSRFASTNSHERMANNDAHEADRVCGGSPVLGDLITVQNVRIALAVDPGNSFGIWEMPVTDESEGLGFAVYPVPSFFNHRQSRFSGSLLSFIY
ncbi:hypothetical protein EW026_g4618 [Hermanssonia centrifuga]|uniref:SET domain-containing protein n=1 Tax=Hermanssonia centrifuga TaxID=98765 RepID=A0A4S4KIB3_9APHY|nr:hypothetical protein EW026_g4618 [Hermanssonia centrifuga]